MAALEKGLHHRSAYGSFFRERRAPEPAAVGAAIAIGAGWPEEAESLLTKSGRFDLLALLLERQGRVKKAIEVRNTTRRCRHLCCSQAF